MFDKLDFSYITRLYKISCLAENTSSNVVFREVLAAAGRDVVRKDISRMRGGWPIQDAFYVSNSNLGRCILYLKL